MKTQSLFIALTVVNLGLLLFLLSKTGVVQADGALPVLRGSGLQIVDSQGRVRASLAILPAGTTVEGAAHPETVLFRLIDGNGQPSVKIGASGTTSGLSFVGGDDDSYIILQADGPKSLLKMVGPNGQQQLVTP